MATSKRKKVLSIRKKSVKKISKKNKSSKKSPIESKLLSKKEEFKPMRKVGVITVIVIIVVVIALSIGGIALAGWLFGKGEHLSTMGSGGSSGNLPNNAVYNPKDYDIQAQNRCHGTGCGNFGIDIWDKVDPEQHHFVNDSLLIDEQNSAKFRKLQVPLVVSNDPAGGTLPWIGKDPIYRLDDAISFNPQHVSSNAARAYRKIDRGRLEDVYDLPSKSAKNKFGKAITYGSDDAFIQRAELKGRGRHPADAFYNSFNQRGDDKPYMSATKAGKHSNKFKNKYFNNNTLQNKYNGASNDFYGGGHTGIKDINMNRNKHKNNSTLINNNNTNVSYKTEKDDIKNFIKNGMY